MPIISQGSPLSTGVTPTTPASTSSSSGPPASGPATFSSGPLVYTTPSSCLEEKPVYITAFVAPKDCSLQYSPYATNNNNVNTTPSLICDIKSASCYPSGWFPYCVERVTLTPL